MDDDDNDDDDDYDYDYDYDYDDLRELLATSVILGMCAGRWGRNGSSRQRIDPQKLAKVRQNSASSRSWFFHGDSAHEGTPFKDPGAILTMKTDMIVEKSRPLSRSGAIWRQNTRVDAIFSK